MRFALHERGGPNFVLGTFVDWTFEQWPKV